jgi:hypothetical protein
MLHNTPCLSVTPKKRGGPYFSLDTKRVPYDKKNVTYVIEETLMDSSDQLVAIVLWKNALVASMERVRMHRMTVVLVSHGDEWAFVSMHITPVQP